MTTAIPTELLDEELRSEAARPVRRSALRQVLTDPGGAIGTAWILLVVVLSGAAQLLPDRVFGLLRDPLDQNLADAGQLPSAAHLLGTDTLGRDILSRLLFGGLSAIGGVLLCVVTAAVIGVLLGLIAGYFGGVLDAIGSIVAEVLQTLPGIIVMLLAVAIFGTDLQVGMITLGLLLSSGFFRLTRSSVSLVKGELFVDAARVAGIRSGPIMFRHILPNVLRPIIVQASLTATLALLLQAGLSFLGQGPPPPSPQWGSMVREAAGAIYQYPFLMIPSGLVITLTALAFNTIGDALVDTTNVRAKQRVRRSRRARPSEAAAHDAGLLLAIDGLHVSTSSGSEIVHGVSLAVAKGRTVGLVGESGSGKTLTALSVVGLLPEGVRISAGSIRLDDRELTALAPREYAALRGVRIAMISQEPMVALDPSSTVAALLVEPLRRHRRLSRSAARRAAADLLEQVGIKRVDSVLASYPHQLSGGMAQRVAIAVALTGEPDLLVADEPTTALDVTVQAEILDLLRRLQAELGMGLLLVTHDFGVVADICDEIVVMRNGRVVESGVSLDVFDRPQHPYTRELLAAAPEAWPVVRREAHTAEPLLTVDGLDVAFRQGLRKAPFVALRDVGLTIHAGETVGLVGESGSGKTTLGRAILGLVPATAGSISFAGEDITRASAKRRQQLSSEIQVVFQNPYSSLDPRLTVGAILEEPLRAHGGYSASSAKARIKELLDRVELPADARDRRPAEFSGGQRQRIAIARALALKPRLIVCDEALSALDLSTQRRVVTLLDEIQRDTGVAYLFIAHDLTVVKNLSDRVVVMYHGEIVEEGDPEVLGTSPTQAYTQRLLLAAPVPHPVRQAERRAQRLLQTTSSDERNQHA